MSYSQENSGAKFENRPLTRACKPTQGNLKQLSELNRLKIIHFLQQDKSNAEICEELLSITRTQCHQIINSDNNEVLLFVWCFRGVTNTYPEHARNSTFYHTDASCLVTNRSSASKQYLHSEDLRRGDAVFLFRAAEQKFSGTAFLWRVIFLLGVTVKIQSADNKLIQVRNNLRCLSFKSYKIKYVCLALFCASQAAQAHNARSYISILLFLLVRERSTKPDMSLAYTIV